MRSINTKALKDKQPISFETYFDARPYAGWYDVNVYPHSQGISVYFQIITERREAEEKLRESRQLLQNILEASPVGLGYLEGRKLGWANPAIAADVSGSNAMRNIWVRMDEYSMRPTGGNANV